MPDKWGYRPHDGTLEQWDYDHSTNEAYINRQQDLSLWRKTITEARNTGAADKGVVEKGEFQHAYSIPATVQLELMLKGIDILSSDKDMQRRMVQEIEMNYPQCKVTEKKLWIPT